MRHDPLSGKIERNIPSSSYAAIFAWDVKRWSMVSKWPIGLSSTMRPGKTMLQISALLGIRLSRTIDASRPRCPRPVPDCRARLFVAPQATSTVSSASLYSSTSNFMSRLTWDCLPL